MPGKELLGRGTEEQRRGLLKELERTGLMTNEETLTLKGNSYRWR